MAMNTQAWANLDKLIDDNGIDFDNEDAVMDLLLVARDHYGEDTVTGLLEGEPVHPSLVPLIERFIEEEM